MGRERKTAEHFTSTPSIAKPDAAYDNHTMKRILFAVAACSVLAACGPKPATFEIEADGVEKAELDLCDQKSPMKQTGKVFTVDRKISCNAAAPLIPRFARDEFQGAKYPRIVLAVSFGEPSSTRTWRHSFGFAKSVIW